MGSEQMDPLFFSMGYDKLPTNLPEYVFYYRRESQGVTLIFVIDYRRGIYISEDQYTHMKSRGAEFFRVRGEADVHMLTLILAEDTQRAKSLCAGDVFCWLIDTGSGRLLIHENQTADFYGLRAILEDYLTYMSYAADDAGRSAAEYENHTAADRVRPARERWTKERIMTLPWVNICLVAVNVLVFLICTFTGDLLYNKGAFGVAEIMKDGSWYRIITALFLHAGVQHLFGNMIVLYYVGEIVEKKMGHVRYALVYFLSGLVGNLFSAGYEILTAQPYSSVGASGAVFGIEGALLLLVFLNHGRFAYVTTGRLVFAIAFSIYCGFTSANVNNAAHIGGVLTGFAAAAILEVIRPHVGTGKDRGFNEN